jgi:uncharacterized repeat protein (TIGR01451 family)
MLVTRSTQRQRKGGKQLFAALLASAVLWGASVTANAEIINSVVATGTAFGVDVTSTANETVDVVDQIATISLDKVGVLNDPNGNGKADPGETVSYTFTATNTGNVTLTNVNLIDNKVAPTGFALFADTAPTGDSTDTPSAGWAVFAPGDTLTATAVYTLVTADLDAGEVVNNATVSATTVPGLAVTATDTVTVPLSTDSSIALEKTGTLNLGNAVADVGDIITYQFKVTNTGPTTVRNVSVSDPMLLMAALPGADKLDDLIQLASIPSDPITTAAIPVVTLGNAPREPAIWHAAVPQEPTALHATRRLVRLTPGDEAFKAGDRIGVYFALTNSGDVPLININVLQPGSDAYGTSLDILNPNSTDSASILFSRVLTEEDITTGQVEFVSGITASARGQTIVETLRGPMSLLDVESSGDVVTASITPATVVALAPGADAMFSATYQLTQADIDAGQVLNTAQASATNVLAVVITSDDSATVPVPQAPAIAVEKTGLLALGADNKASVGDLVTYTFTLTNTGNTTLNDVRLVDPLPGMNITFVEFDGFAPGATQDFTGTYPITQIDIDAGKVENQATASGLPANGTTRTSGISDDPVTPTVGDKTVTVIPQAPTIAVVKEIATVADTNASGHTDIGDIVTYKFKVRNDGNVALNNVYVKDRDPLVVSNLLPPTGVTLAVGEEKLTTFTATYTLKQADADRGFYDNTADAFGSSTNGTVVQDESHPSDYLQNAPTHLVIPPKPGVAVLKPQPVLVDTNSNGQTDLGDVLNYTIKVINTGNVTLTNVVVTDPKANFTFTIPTLAPGLLNAQSVPASYTITKPDMLAGQVENIAFAEATYLGTPVGDQSDTTDITQDNPTITPIVPHPAIALVKRQPDIIDTPTVDDVNGNGVTDEGDQLVYTFAVTNTGNVTLDNIVITDAMGTVVNTRTTPLEAGDTDDTNFKLTYTLVTADITRGNVTNTADVVALSPTNAPARDTSDDDSILQNDPTVTPLANLIAPGIALLKTYVISDVNNNTITDAGDTITYTFSVTNTGNVKLTNIVVTDPKLAGEGIALMPGNGVIGTLARGATSAVLSATHVITQADIDASSYDNQASVTGNFGLKSVTDLSDDSELIGNDPTVVRLEHIATIAVIKPEPTNEDVNGNDFIDSGDKLTYSFEIHNTGNVTLYDVVLVDSTANQVFGGPIAVFPPGAVDTTTFTATRVVTDVDALAKKIVNTATVSASETAGGALNVTDISDETSLNGREPTVTPVVIINPALSKTANRASIRRGERVEYTITATALGTGPYDIADLLPPGMTFITGSATVDGVAAVPAIDGKTLTFANIKPKKTRIITIKLSMQAAASTTMQTGETINRARLYLNVTGQFLADASARVTIKEEAIFDCGEIIGRVFDDLNNNGYMDDGEVGLPGVRVVTVKGLLVTTDKFGRFHVTCADIPNAQIGSNFLMKLDPRTLPAGYVLTTENPRDVRLTRGKITKLNFGASKQRDVALDLTRDAFGSGLDLKPKFAVGIDRLVTLLSQGRGALTITYRCGVHAPIADDRIQAVAELLQAKWKQEGGNKPLKITTRVECGK